MQKKLSGIVYALVMRGGYQSRLMSVHVLNPKAQHWWYDSREGWEGEESLGF